MSLVKDNLGDLLLCFVKSLELVADPSSILVSLLWNRLLAFTRTLIHLAFSPFAEAKDSNPKNLSHVHEYMSYWKMHVIAKLLAMQKVTCGNK